MNKSLDVKNIVDIRYIVTVGSTRFVFESGTAALKFADTARVTCTGTTWTDNEYDVSIQLIPVWKEEEPEEELHCDEQLEKECEA